MANFSLRSDRYLHDSVVNRSFMRTPRKIEISGQQSVNQQIREPKNHLHGICNANFSLRSDRYFHDSVVNRSFMRTPRKIEISEPSWLTDKSQVQRLEEIAWS